MIEKIPSVNMGPHNFPVGKAEAKQSYIGFSVLPTPLLTKKIPTRILEYRYGRSLLFLPRGTGFRPSKTLSRKYVRTNLTYAQIGRMKLVKIISLHAKSPIQKEEVKLDPIEMKKAAIQLTISKGTLYLAN